MQIIHSIPASYLELIYEKWSTLELNQWSEKINNLLENIELAPDKRNLFKALELCSFQDVKVVILGQDPYPTPGHANGLAFSIEDFVQPFPKSLLNIFKELKRSVPGYDFPLTGNLTSWAEQGVLLLNTCLTTEKGVANAHQNKGWEEFTSLIITSLFEKQKNLVGMFWGKQAQLMIKNIKTEEHLILESSHPSPLSVYRGFDGCNHFQLCNDYLLKKDEIAIEWQT